MINSWGQWWDAHFGEPNPETGNTRWVPEKELLPQMSPRFRSIYNQAQKRLARSLRRGDPTRRYIAVATRKYRARRRRR